MAIPRAQKDRKWYRVFLAALDESGMVTEACKKAKVARQTAYEARQKDEAFAIAWHDVEERVVERMEREAYRRAVEGTERLVVSAGREIGREREYSDSLLTFLLKARRPEKYRENYKVEHTGRVEHAVSGLEDLTDAQLLKKFHEA